MRLQQEQEQRPLNGQVEKETAAVRKIIHNNKAASHTRGLCVAGIRERAGIVNVRGLAETRLATTRQERGRIEGNLLLDGIEPCIFDCLVGNDCSSRCRGSRSNLWSWGRSYSNWGWSRSRSWGGDRRRCGNWSRLRF